MTTATRSLVRLSKLGDRTDRALLVLHHSLTGKAGAGKATGFDRSSFGRNSKVLQGWTRAQVNIAPGSADNCNVLVIASGKNNNFKEFVPFAIELKESTMTYEVKDDFDLMAWQADMTGTKKSMTNAGSDQILGIITAHGGRIEKKDLIEKARALTGRGDKHLRGVIDTMQGDDMVEEFKEPRENKRDAVFICLPREIVEEDE